MKSKFAFGKSKFAFSFNDWVLKGDILGLKYKVTNKEEVVMEVKQKVFSFGDVYYIDITKPENELVCLLILLAIDSSHSTKAEDTGEAVREKRRNIRHSSWL